MVNKVDPALPSGVVEEVSFFLDGEDGELLGGAAWCLPSEDDDVWSFLLTCGEDDCTGLSTTSHSESCNQIWLFFHVLDSMFTCAAVLCRLNERTRQLLPLSRLIGSRSQFTITVSTALPSFQCWLKQVLPLRNYHCNQQWGDGQGKSVFQQIWQWL